MSSLLDQVARRATRGTRAPIRPHARAGHTAFGLLGPLLPAGFGAGTPQWTAVSEAARPIVDRVGGGTHGARRGSGWPAAVALSAPAAGPQQPPSTGDPRVLAVAR
ncbi:hypothetical protein [Kutzneria kofuensis]|uniref:Uncharacterized protein n=1 Tax=Kutzneria kofuensis TaxID=103725 RepID=A0A7W9KE50_9PSEU|nr:hypothetical protein [Kutzneria kofuensis]MBB5890938.1 hypothetical protein [Kutzneria kofuensis]